MTFSAEQIQKIREKAEQLGFVACGFTSLHTFAEEKEQFLQWLKKGYQGEMSFLERNIEKRFYPASLQAGFKSAIVVLMNYFPKNRQQGNQVPKISKYALGQNYHKVMKHRLYLLQKFINIEISKTSVRCFVDSAPVYEKKLAIDAGLGWEGKNTLLINKQYGSFVFIGELLTDIELHRDERVITSHCGTCTRCIDACPTNALQPYHMDASRCISYLTIEKKSDNKPDNIQTSPWIYGCDVCQDVCPWNQKLQPTDIEEFLPKPFLLSAGIQEWEKLTVTEFEKIFTDSSILRTGLERIKRNLEWIKNEREC